MRLARCSALLFLAVALLHSAVGSVPAQAADYKIGYVDVERIFREFNGTKSAESQFNQDVEGWMRQYDAKKAELDKLSKEFEAQRLMLSDARRKERENELQAKISELEQQQREIWGPTGKAAQRNEQLTREIITQIREIVSRIAQSEGYSFILDAGDGNLLYGDPNLDLTDRVLTELNAGQQQQQTTTPGH